jgi:hypothetical protein
MTRIEALLQLSLQVNQLDDVSVAILAEIGGRLLRGQHCYGNWMSKANDGKDWIAEAVEEHLDSCVYIAREAVKLRDGRAAAGGLDDEEHRR